MIPLGQVCGICLGTDTGRFGFNITIDICQDRICGILSVGGKIPRQEIEVLTNVFEDAPNMFYSPQHHVRFALCSIDHPLCSYDGTEHGTEIERTPKPG